MKITIIEQTAKIISMECGSTVFFAEWDKYAEKWFFRITDDFTPIGDGYFNPITRSFVVMDPIVGDIGNELYKKFTALIEG